MGKICGLKYSSVRYNEDEEEEYYFDELEDWLTEDEVEALTAHQKNTLLLHLH